MKLKWILFTTLSLTSMLRAEGSQTIDLGNGTSVEVSGGRVSVKMNPGVENVTGSVSQSVSSHSSGDGETVTSVTSERNGQRVTRRITVSKDGKVTISGDPEKEPAAKEKPAPAPAPVPAGGWLGVHTIPLSESLRAQVDVPEGEGVLLEVVSNDGPAAKAGLLPNDILLSLDDAPVKGVDTLRENLGKLPAGKAVSLKYLRKGKTATVQATLGERPAEALPGSDVDAAVKRLVKEIQSKGTAAVRAAIVDDKGKVHVVESTGEDPFDLLLKNPDVPEEMKERLRKTREEMSKLQR